MSIGFLTGYVLPTSHLRRTIPSDQSANLTHGPTWSVLTAYAERIGYVTPFPSLGTSSTCSIHVLRCPSFRGGRRVRDRGGPKGVAGPVVWTSRATDERGDA